jgi:hypothetical protein
MRAYSLHALVSETGNLVLENLPFKAGTPVEVIITESHHHDPPTDRFPLWGTVIEYKDPFEPIAVEDWEALK